MACLPATSSHIEEMCLNRKEVSPTNLYDRVKKLLVSLEWSDCTFTVSGKDFKAHKLILTISSPVFEAMFYGPLSTNQNVLITDIEPETFQLLLNYIYTDKVQISSVEQAFELLYASKKYLLQSLVQMCVAYIRENVSIDNVIDILNYPEYLQDKQLTSYSLKLFCEHASYLLHEYKNIISYPCMKLILDSEKINIKEKDLIKHVFEWTTFQCKQNNDNCTIDNRRNILIKNGIFKLLRFCTLSLNDLEEVVKSTNNLLYPFEYEYIKEVIKKSENVTCNNVINLLSPNEIPRSSLKLQWYFCHRSPLRSVAPIVIDINNFIVNTRIKVNKPIFLNSLYIPTRMAPAVTFRNNAPKLYSEQLCITVVSESDNNVIKFTNFMNTVEYNSFVDIDLNEPCLIKKDKWYKISFLWTHNRFTSYSYVVEVRERLYKSQKISIEFDESLSSNVSSGSFLGGLKFCM
ncbi:kelch-like protein 40 [Achroia grisella]|uniref:kelch-like protein 40 n=1 Tax=Achroia grisella TaxID=688607 RepID=UPI0027D32CAB|nr:kelch-like protein 40 [Achroia grisella]